jgi:hypothetical protein
MNSINLIMGRVGLEPTRPKSPHFECGASTNFAIRPWMQLHHYSASIAFVAELDRFQPTQITLIQVSKRCICHIWRGVRLPISPSTLELIFVFARH